MSTGNESHPEFVWWLFGGGRGSGVDHILGDLEPVCPVILLVVTEDSQYGFHRLIRLF
jgi:hypothetical protein